MQITLRKGNSKKLIAVKRNEKDFPNQYTCSFLEQGLVSYEDVGAGIALLKKETIDNMLPSIIGKPVLIDHLDVGPEDFKKHAVGYVTDAYFNSGDGMFYCKFILTDDKAKKVVEQGYSVSCSFNVDNTIGGGEYHAIRYNEEITGATFTHLALVSNPRYEECKIYANGKGARIHNDNITKEVKMFGFKSKKNAQESVDPKDPAKEKFNAENSFVMIGKDKVSVATLLNAVEEKEEKENTLSLEDSIEFNGKEFKVSDLVAKYQSNRESAKDEEEKEKKDDKKKEDCNDSKEEKEKKDSAKDEEEKKNEAIGKDNPEPQEVVDKAKSSAKAEEEKEKKDDKKNEDEEGKEKKNDVKYFKRLNSMKDGAEIAHAVAVDTLTNKIDRGQDRYSSKKKETK